MTAGGLDTLGVLDAFSKLPEHARAAVVAAQAAPVYEASGPVLVWAGGTAAPVAHCLAHVADEDAASSVPVVVREGPALPAWAAHDVSDPGITLLWLVIDPWPPATSPVFGDAADAGCQVVVVTARADVAAAATQSGAAAVLLDPLAVPRLAVASTAVAGAVLLGRLGVLAGAEVVSGEAIERIGAATASAVPAADGKRLARRFPVVYGSDPLAGFAARSWKQSVNLAAKAPAFSNAFPGFALDEVSGYGQHGDVTRQLFAAVELSWAGDDGGEARFDRARPFLEEAISEFVAVRSEATAPLGAFVELSLLGAATAAHMAVEAGVDPGPAEAVDRLGDMLGG